MRATRLRTVGITAVSLAILGSCGTGDEVIGAGQEQGTDQKATFAQTLGACPGEPPEGADAFEFVTTPGAWLRLDRVSTSNDQKLAGAAWIDGTPELIGGDQTAADAWTASQQLPLRSTEATAQLAQTASSGGAEVFVKTGFDGDPREVILVLAFQGDDFAFVGECKYERFTVPFEDRFGDRASETVRSIVGADSSKTSSIVGATPAQPPAAASILNPEYTDPKELDRLELATFSIPDLPDSWVGPYTVCTRIELGWSDCVDLASAESAAMSVSAYVDPSSPSVEAWLLDENANLLAPIARLAEITVPRELFGESGDERTADIALVLPGETGVGEAVKSPESASYGVSMSSKQGSA